MPAHTAHIHPSALLASNHTAPADPPTTLPTNVGPPTSTHRPLVTERMVDTVMTLTIVALEEELIPAQGAGDTLYVYGTTSEITHDVRRTLRIFDGDVNEAIESICTFVTEGVLGDPTGRP